MAFRKAERKQAKLRLALCGPAGSGKTYSALLIAQGLAPGGRIALIDTERSSGELYADLVDYDCAPLAPPFTPNRYIELIREAEKTGYGVLIVDSLSHAWAGQGGILEMHDQAAAASRSGNSFMAWREVTPQHNALVDTMLGADLHLIVTLRTKTAYDVVDDGNGKKRPIKIGLAPVQRDGLEYEFTIVMDLSIDGHIATATKDRTRLFDGQHFVPSPETGKHLREWLESGKAVQQSATEETSGSNTSASENGAADAKKADQGDGKERRLTKAQPKRLEARIAELGLDRERVKAWVNRSWGVERLSELTREQYQALDQRLDRWATQLASEEAGAEREAIQAAAQEAAQVSRSELRDRVARLREQAAQVRQAAAFADGQAYYQDLDCARSLEDEAQRLERAAAPLSP